MPDTLPRSRSQEPDRAGRSVGLSEMERFMLRVNKTDTCWLWTGQKFDGYGKFKVRFSDGSWGTMRAHRYSWAAHNGPIPIGMYVCHHCDVRGCVNPGHLFVGTASDNTVDACRKGRIVRPASNRMKACRKGHPYTPETTKILGNGKRTCVICWRAAKRFYKQRHRPTVTPIPEGE